MTQYSIKAQTNKVYNSNNSNMYDTTILVTRGCVVYQGRFFEEATTLNNNLVLNHGTYLEIKSQDQEISYLVLSFPTDADLEACYSELSKWTNRTIESACDISDDLIGSGVQGDVYHGTYRQGSNQGIAVAVKKTGNNAAAEVFTNAYLEEHENVLVALDVLRDDAFTYIVMPYLEESETLTDFLERKIANNSRLKRKTAKIYMRQILSGVAHLHASGISHADMHLGNIMVQHNLQKVTIIDFGWSKFNPADQLRDIRKCGTILEKMTEAGRMGKKARELIDLLREGVGVTATEALNHAWFKPGLFSRIFRRKHYNLLKNGGHFYR